MNLWRIAAETRKYPADDLSGAGAAKHPGRWNDDGEAVLYTATSLALAVLETAAHVDAAGLPLNRFVVRLEVPDDVWAAREERPPSALPAAWDAIPAGVASVKVGSAWLRARTSAVLLLPSVVVPEERVALLNPNHPDATRVKPTVLRAFPYDRLFRRA